MIKKSNLRKLNWEEEVYFNSDTDEEEKESINDHCKRRKYTDYKYNIFYEVGKDYIDLNNLDPNLEKLIKNYNYYSVSNLF